MQPDMQFQNLSQFTPFPGEPMENYAEYFGDPMAQQVPDEGQFTARDPNFSHNLCQYIGDSELSRIGTQLTDGIQKDIDDRQNWIRVLTEGIDYLGIGGHRTRTSMSTRNTDIYSSTLMSIGMRVTCKIHSTLFPSGDFIDTTITGMQTEELVDRAMRISAYFNYYLRDVAEEYIPDKKQAIFWMVFEGSVFSKVFYDKLKRRPVAPYVRAESVIINSDASSLDDADRITHEFTLTEREYLARVRAGEYVHATLETAQIYDNKVRQKIDQKVGIQNTDDDMTKVYAFHESLVYLDIPKFEHLDEQGKPSGRKLPYVVTKDKNSNAIVSIYRNWNEQDPEFTKKNYYVQHKYFTGVNVYGFGLFHLLLGYAKAETELQQQLLKAAQLSNAPVLLMAPGMRSEQSQLTVSPGAINQFNSFGADFNNNTKPLGFTPPSPISLELKKMLTEGMEAVAIARQITPENLPANTSATTMLGVLGTMHVIEDSLMNDLYVSFKKELQLLYDLFAEWLPDQPYPFAVEGGDHVIMKQDFQNNISIRPSLDPNVSNATFQLIINDTINTLAQQAPNLYNQKEIHKRLLKAMKVSDPDKLFKDEKPPEPPPPLDPISENKEAMLGKPIKAYKWQDQDAYIIVHQNMVNNLQQDKSQDQSNVIAALQGNIQEREAFKYVAEMENRIGQPLPEDPAQLPPEQQNHIAMMAAQAVMQKQAQEQAANPPPLDPSQVMEHEIAVKEKGVELKAQQDAQKNELEQFKLVENMKLEQMKVQMELERIKLERDRMEAENKIKLLQLELERSKADLQAQTHSYDSTLRYEQDIARDEETVRKNDLDTQTQAYDATLRFESEAQRSKDDAVHKMQETNKERQP